MDIYKNFRNPILDVPGGILKKFDEPTYLTFRLFFYDKNNNVELTNYDKMPHPLFSTSREENIESRNNYSAYNFLSDNNEFIRAKMLTEFISKFNTIQTNYQWYFQSIEGLDNILQVKPKRGYRTNQEGRIKIKMLEGIDLRISHILNLYKKVVWDDVYQRWILPDMMRYFALDIYITEFRTFHKSNNNINNIITQTGLSNRKQESGLVLSILENTIPTWILKCERCEIDIETINTQYNTLSTIESNMVETEFDIKIGNLTEEYVNPIFDFTYNDLIVNGVDRTKEFETPDSQKITAGTPAGDIPVDQTRSYDPLSVSNNNKVYANYSISSQGQLLAQKDHESGKPYINKGNIDNIKNSIINYSTDLNSINPLQQNTWFGNALKFGESFSRNFIESKVDKAKITNIPGLGFSFNEAKAAIESKNFMSVFGLIKKAINQSISKTIPSSQLEKEIINSTFKQFLTGITKSKATNNDELELIQAANIALNDKGEWEKINDFSKATDLLGKGETNIKNEIQNKNGQINLVNTQSNNDRSLATDLDNEPDIINTKIISEGISLSKSTQNKIL